MKITSSSSSSSLSYSIIYSFFSFFLTQNVQTFTLPFKEPKMMCLPLTPIEIISVSLTFMALQHFLVRILQTQTQPSAPPLMMYSPTFPRQVIDVLGYVPNIPLMTSISFELLCILMIQIPSAQTVTWRSSVGFILLITGSMEGIGLHDNNQAVLRSQQQARLLGVEPSVAKTYFEVSPTEEIFMDISGRRMSNLTSRNSRSHSSKVPPIKPTRQSLSIIEKEATTYGFVMIL